MRTLLISLLATTALVFGTNSSADAKSRSAYRVSIKAPSSSTAEKLITISGKVTGSKAAGHSVTIQRHYIGGTWKNVARARVSSRGRYSVKVETPRGGTTSFRVLKAGSRTHRAGHSAIRDIPVWRWLDLAAQPSAQLGDAASATEVGVYGASHPSSMTFFGQGTVVVKAAGLCTTVTGIATRADGNLSPDDVVFHLRGGSTGLTSPDLATVTVGAAGPQTVSASVTGQLLLGIEADAGVGGRAAFVDGRILCNADQLPLFASNDLAV